MEQISDASLRTLAPPDRTIPAREMAGAALIVAGAFAVILAWAPSRLFDLERYLVPKALALHVVALGVIALGLVPLRRSAWGRTEVLLAAFVGWSALATVLATNRWLALEGLGISFSAVVVFLTARRLPASLREFVLGGILSAVVVGAALGVAQAYGLEGAWLSDSRPPGGTFGNRNFLGHISAIAAPVLLLVALHARRPRSLVLGLIGLAVLTEAVVLTRSRAAWLGGVAGVACALIGVWVARRWDRAGSDATRTVRRLSAGATVMAGAVGLAVFVPNQLDWVTDTPYAATLGNLADYQEGSGAGRLVQYRTSLSLMPSDPVFGVGPGNWFVHYPRVTKRGDPAYAGGEMIPTNPWPSSDWVALVVERGALGALLLLLAGGSALADAMRSSDGRNDPRAAGGVAGVLAAALVCGMFDAVLLLAAPSFVVFAGVGVLLAPVEGHGEEASRGGGPRAAALALALVLVLYTSAHTTAIALTAEGTRTSILARAARWAPGEHRLRLALAQRGRCEDARAAGRLMPYHARVKRLVERCG